VIHVENLTFAYGGAASDTIRNLNFSVQPGEIFGFLGPSGAGKSTTQKILIGLLRGFRGDVRIFDRPLKPSPEYYRRLGIAFEFPYFYQNLTARENLRFFAGLYQVPRQDEQIDDLLNRVGLAEEGDKRVSRYSKGMKTRLNICRALIHRPELLFLDEPTTGLDPSNSRMIRELILDLKNQGQTVFLNTHNMEVASQLCDRVAFIVDGEIAALDSPRNFMHLHGKPLVKVGWGSAENPETAEFPLPGLAQNGEFLAALDREDLRFLHSQEATLDEVFIAVTGRSLQ